MSKQNSMPVALSIAGSDSGGGAGIQADLQTFAALGVHGTTAIACLTAQNPREVKGVQPAWPQMLRQQLEAVFEELPPAAMKTGMLYSRNLMVVVADFLETHRVNVPLVVDPVMVATSGARLLRTDAVRLLQKRLLGRATLVTPNTMEAALLWGREVNTVEDLRAVARWLHEHHGCAALVKGGHLKGLKVAVDVLFDGREEWLLEAPWVRGVSTHGTGCTYSAAITAGLAKGLSLLEAVSQAKDFITQAIAHSQRIGRHQVLGWRADKVRGNLKAGGCNCGDPACQSRQGGVY